MDCLSERRLVQDADDVTEILQGERKALGLPIGGSAGLQVEPPSLPKTHLLDSLGPPASSQAAVESRVCLRAASTHAGRTHVRKVQNTK